MLHRRPREVVLHFARRLEVRPSEDAPAADRERYAAFALACFTAYVPHDQGLADVDSMAPFLVEQLWPRLRQWEAALYDGVAQHSKEAAMHCGVRHVMHNYEVCAAAEHYCKQQARIRAEQLLLTDAVECTDATSAPNLDLDFLGPELYGPADL